MTYASGAPRVFIAGDSAAAVYGPDHYPQFGWGMMLPCGLRNAQVLNYAHPGLSSKSFITSGRLKTIAAALRKGDTLLIAFGHNDEQVDSPHHFTDPDGDFPKYLGQYISVARAHGAVPVLVTPATRRSFASGKLVDTHASYARAIRKLAQQDHVALIDLDVLSMHWLQSLGPDASKAYYMTSGAPLPWMRSAGNSSTDFRASSGSHLPWMRSGYSDDTHFQELGARAMANMVADSLSRLKIPLSSQAIVNAPALTRTVPAGSAICE